MFNKKSPLKLTLLIAVSSLWVPTTQAGTYLFLEAGQGSSSIEVGPFEAFNQAIIDAGGTASLTKNTQDRSIMLGLGYQYSANLAVEMSYLDLGTVSAKSLTSDTNSEAVTRNRIIKESVEQKGVAFSVVGQYEITQQWLLKGHLGLAWLDQKATGVADGQSVNAAGTVVSTQSESISETNQQWVPLVGVGAGYQLNDHWQLGLNLQRLMNVKPGKLGEYDIDMINFRLGYHF